MHNSTPFIPNKFKDASLQLEFRELVLDRLKDEIVLAIQNILVSHKLFKHSNGEKLAEATTAYVENGNIIVHSELDYFKYQNDGVKGHTMWYLLGKTIPIKDTATGKIIYRKATLGAFLKGKWVHKGYEGKHFIEAGINMAMLQLPKIMYEVKRDMEESMLAQHGVVKATGTFGW